MSIANMVPGFVMGFGIKIAARGLEDVFSKYYKKYAPVIMEEICENVDGFNDWLHEKTGIQLFSKKKQEKFEKTISDVCFWVEKHFVTQKNIRIILNALLRDRREDALAEAFRRIQFDSIEELKEKAPKELLDLISEAKHAWAKKEFSRLWALLFPGEKVKETDVDKGIRAMVKAKSHNNANARKIMESLPFREKMEYLIRESEKRQEELIA